MEAQILTNNQVIPYYDYKTDVGYQRQPGAVRIKELAKKLYTQDVDLPTLVLVNIRTLEATNHLKNGIFKYNPAIHGRLFLFDGQHRILAMQQAIEIAEANKDSVNLERLRKKLIPTMEMFMGWVMEFWLEGRLHLIPPGPVGRRASICPPGAPPISLGPCL